MSLCKYRDIFGRPNEGVHSMRFMGLAFVDLYLTLVLAGIISYKYEYNVIFVFMFLMLLSIVIHKLFCVDTALLRKLKIN